MKFSFLGCKCFIFLFISINFSVIAQSSNEEIDELLKLSNDAFDKFESETSLEYANLALEKSQIIQSSDYIANSHYYLARAFEDLGKQNESLKHLKLAENEPYTKSDVLLNVKIKELKAMNYMTLNMYSQSMEQYHLALNQIENVKNDSARTVVKSRIFGNLHVVHRDAGNLDSANYYLKKEIGILNQMKEASVFSYLSTSYLDFGLYYLEQKRNLDSAGYFIQKSLSLLEKYNDPFKQDVFRALGDLNFEKKEYKKSLENYLKSLNIMKELDISDASYTYVYRRISDAYKMLGDYENEKLYLGKYISLNDSLLISKENIVDSVVNKMMDEERLKQDNFRNRTYFILLFLFVGFVVKTYFMVRYYKKTKREKRKMQTENLELHKTKVEKEQLEQQLNVAFEEVVQLAKDNSPEFLSRFQEVYPDFYNQLTKQHPSLLSSEIKFCAMLFLNFSSKDIAEFTFVTPKAVQNRKNRLRKKLNISSEEDLSIWMQKISD